MNDSKINNFDNKLDQSYQLLSDKIDILEKNQNGLMTDLTRVTKNNDRLKQENTMLKENVKEYKTICQAHPQYLYCEIMYSYNLRVETMLRTMTIIQNNFAT